MTQQTQQFQTIAQVMAESMAEQQSRLQSIERSAERSRLELLGRLTRVENSVAKAKVEQSQLVRTLVGEHDAALGQIDGSLASVQGKCSHLLSQMLNVIRDDLPRKKDAPAGGLVSNDIPKLRTQQERQLEHVEKAILSLKSEQRLYQQSLNETIAHTQSEQKKLLETIVQSTDGNKERLRVLKQMLIVQRGTLDRLDRDRAGQPSSRPIKNEPL
ncbi:hypothetical protein BGZ70_000283 [Mortierella alpina]|uniref:Uncharacterized protein n=1 Tax=Mortierella alpina TaxID=64518 RepID=A0A9P6JCW2_MORAP|nr:hypothetical protein BGZ70_000283 [Mortierella alpina]